MAFTKYDAILERVRELLEDGLGSYRAISASRFTGNAPEGQGPEAQARFGALAQKPIEASITAVERHPQRLTIVGNVQIERFRMEVRVVRTLPTDTSVDDDLRDDAKALAVEDADVIKQSLEWPGNLTTTAGGTSTDCKALIYEDSRVRAMIDPKSGGASRLVTIHNFLGTAISRPATS